MSVVNVIERAVALIKKDQAQSPKSVTYERLERLAAMRGETPEKTAAFILGKVLGSNINKNVPDYDSDRSNKELTNLSLQYLWGLSDRLMAKLQELADMREEPILRTWRIITKNAAVESIPGKLFPQDFVKSLDFKSVELVDHKTAKIVLNNGRVFYGFPSKTRYIHMFQLLKDLIPKGFTPETYVMGVDAVTRYHKGTNYFYVPGKGETVIECGAYVGLKAIKYADLVGSTGKVVTIEIDQENYDMMYRNIEANNLLDRVVPVRCGVWNKKGEMEDRHEDRIYHTLADVDEKRIWEQRTVVPVNTLDNIIDDAGLKTVDLINIQVNGAEVEALEGLERHFNDIKVYRIAAYYTDEKGAKADQVVEYLEQRGAKIVQRTKSGSITAVTAPHFDEIKKRLQDQGRDI